MMKRKKYLLIIVIIVFNNKVNAQKKLEKLDSCFKTINELGLQKFPAQRFRYEINRFKYALDYCSVLIETEEEFKSFMHKNRATVVDSLNKVINFNKNAIVVFLIHGSGCGQPTANVYVYNKSVIIEIIEHGGCQPNWIFGNYTIIDKTLFKSLTKTYFCTKHEN